MADTHEERLAAYELESRAKYTAAEIEEMGKKGQAFSNDDGSFSYPIGDEADLKNAIHAVGRGNSDHDAIRKYIMGRAKDLGADVLIPSNWASDGSIDAEEEQKGLPAVAARAEMRGRTETRISTRSEFELREVPNGTGGTNLRFTGFASVTGDEAAYEMEDWLGPWTESITPGAFKKTLDGSADVAFLLNHQGMTLARTKPGTLKLSEVTQANASPVYGITGLHSEALLDPQNPTVAAMRSAVDRGDLDEMSFAFRVMREEWNTPEYDRRRINEVSLDKGDVSLVNYGANPSTGGTVALRQKLGIRGAGDSTARVLHLVRSLHIWDEFRVGAVLSGANSSELQAALEALHTTDDADIPGIVRALQDIDTALDAGMASIAAVLKTANPDGDANDLEPTLSPPEKESAKTLSFLALPDFATSARARYEIAKGA